MKLGFLFQWRWWGGPLWRWRGADLQEAAIATVIRGMFITRGRCTLFDMISLVKSSGILRWAPLLDPLWLRKLRP